MAEPVSIPPDDVHNQVLVRNVHPPDWKNPTPEGPYNLVVIGAGTGGLICALVASSLGARVALVERHLMGGDCLNVGCVPSKALIRAGHMAHDARLASEIGLGISEAQKPDFAAAMERMRRIRARISREDSAERYAREFGVDVYLGRARFLGEGRIDVDGAELLYRKAVVATGARATAPPVPGLRESGYLDNETVFNLTERPPRLALIGAGPIGCELAQSFQRLGSEVTIYELAPQILNREDPDAAAIVQAALAREGIRMVLSCTLEKIERKGDERILHYRDAEKGPAQATVDAILVGAGRAPNVGELGLDAVGVAFDERTGIEVDDYLRTTNPRIYAVGDVCMAWKFTHAADAAAKIVVQNALFSFGLPFLRKRLSRLVMPWCTYTDPEIAHVGRSERDAEDEGMKIDTYQAPMSETNRAVTEGKEDGLVKVHVAQGTDRIVGATVVGAGAGELISQLTLAIQHRIGLGAFTNLIYPYPTQGEAIKRAAGAYTRTRLTPTVKRVFEALMRYAR